MLISKIDNHTKVKHYLMDVLIHSYLLQQQYKNQTNKKSYTVNIWWELDKG